MPDTQTDVFSKRITNRAEWLVKNEASLDLRFVLHTGDLVNWDTPDHAQFEDASRSIKVLDDAGVPYALAIGNHDTSVVAPGGSAKPGVRPKAALRDTATFNAYFSTTRQKTEGTFEPGKVDNSYQLFSAGGEDWMILTLEMWPRAGAVAWARGVVEAHPDHNVIVQTHYYLEGNGAIVSGRGYGDTSPADVYTQLVSAYPNVRMVLSGHVGAAAQRVDTGVAGNKIVSFLGTFHTSRNNPIRLLEIDTAKDTVTSRMYSPMNDVSFPQYAGTWSGMQFD
jgi:3',5'-cyclic AMP phosphodiesterase CpdA